MKKQRDQQWVMGKLYKMSPTAADRARTKKLAELEDNLAILKAEQSRAENAKIRAQKKQLMATHQIKDYFSHDYAGMGCAEYRFYYGYEYTMCPTHGNDSGCGCHERGWCFVAWRLADDQEIFRIGWRGLVYEEHNVVNALVRGIGVFINKYLVGETDAERG